MTTLLKNADVRTIALGINISRATAALPATATGNIFTVSGGRIVVVSLIGEVTTALGATVTSLAIGTAPTVGTGSTTALATSTAVTSAAVGTHLGINPGGALALDLSTQAGVLLPAAGFLVDIGAVTITTTATNTGSVKWDLTYVPLDTGAQVAAA